MLHRSSIPVALLSYGGAATGTCTYFRGRKSLRHNPRGHRRTGSRSIQSHEYAFHTKLSTDTVLPLRSTDRISAITSETCAFSVIRRLPSPSNVTISPSRAITLWTRYSPRTSRTSATHPRRSSLSAKGPSVMRSRPSTMKGFMLFPFTVRVALIPSDTSWRISSIITALSMISVLLIFVAIKIDRKFKQKCLLSIK